jgi:HPr kinase/phosphorylase
MTRLILANVTGVAIEGRGVLIEGPPGSGKSSLALALIDRGAVLIGDDGLALETRGEHLWALPPPNIASRLEIRGVGIVTLPARPAPLALAIELGEPGERLPTPRAHAVAGATLPLLDFDGAAQHLALRVEWALRSHGLPLPDGAA